MREIEIKLRVRDLGRLEKQLTENECVLSSPVFQHDVIYAKVDAPTKQKAQMGDITIRIRRMPDKAQFNLKQQKSNEMDNLEYETEVKDPEAIHQILLTLGYKPEVEVKKTRKEGKLGEYEICLDTVEKLGTFVELEKLTTDDADPEAVRNELFKVLESFGLSRSDEETKGYDTQMLLL